MISACAVVMPVFAVLMAMASFCVTCSASRALMSVVFVAMSVALTAIPEISWLPRVHSGSVRDDIGLCGGDPRFCGVDGDGVVLCNLFGL